MRNMVTRRAAPASIITLAALMAVLVSGCSFTGLSLVVDDRLTFVAPQDRAAVDLPVTIEWEVEDFTVTTTRDAEDVSGEAGYFGVFIDRTPQPPGEDLQWFAKDDEDCKRDPECPDDDYFSVRGIHTTTKTSFAIAQLPRPVDSNRREFHEVTVVLLDPDGVRIGESAWTIDFEIMRSGP